MNSTYMAQRCSGRRSVFWGLWGLTTLLLLLMVGSTNVEAKGSIYMGFPPDNARPEGLSQTDIMTSTARTVTFSYDRSGRLTFANYGEGELLVYDYDLNGNLKQVTDHFSMYLPIVLRQSN